MTRARMLQFSRALSGGFLVTALSVGTLMAPLNSVTHAATDPCASPAPPALRDTNLDPSSTNPYLISSPAHLAWMAGVDLLPDTGIQLDSTEDNTELAARLQSHYLQTQNIDLTGCAWIPIGRVVSTAEDDIRFSGSYDGGSFTIANMTVRVGEGRLGSVNGFLGLFSALEPGARVTQLTVSNASIGHASTGDIEDVGLLAGFARNGISVTEVSVQGQIAGISAQAGGLIGYFNSYRDERVDTIIDDVSATTTLTFIGGESIGDGYLGGLIGILRGTDSDGQGGQTRVSNAAVQVTIVDSSGELEHAGGLAAETSAPGDGIELDNVTVSGQITAKEYVGGLVGESRAGTTITNSSASVAIQATSTSSFSRVGGLVGDNAGAITNSSASGAVTAAGGRVGGLVGDNGGVITNSSASGAVTGAREMVGGLVGRNDATVSGSRATGAVVGVSSAGGLVGLHDAPGAIVDSSASGNVSATGDDVGGLVGVVSDGATVSKSFANATVTGVDDVGGLVGQIAGGRVEYSYARGAVQGVGTGDSRGGLVGLMRNADTISAIITDSYARVTVSGDQNIGGLVGFASAEQNGVTVSVANSFATGRVTGSRAGGLIGFQAELGTGNVDIANSLWDQDTSGLTASAGGTGKTTNEMTRIMTFRDTATVGVDTPWAITQGWQAFDSAASPSRIWGMCSSVGDQSYENGYPYLLWQASVSPCPVVASDNRDSDVAVSPGIHLELMATPGDPLSQARVLIAGDGLAVGSEYSLVVQSTPRVVASGSIGRGGSVRDVVSLPLDLGAGSHILTFRAVSQESEPLVLVQRFTVTAEGTIGELGATSPALAATGVSGGVGGMLSLASVMVVAGLALMVAQRTAPRRHSLDLSSD